MNPSHAFSSNPRWIALKKAVKQRDGCRCRLCSSTENLRVSHILPRRDYPEEMLNIKNVVVLCNLCENRYGEYLVKFKQFREQMQIEEIYRY